MWYNRWINHSAVYYMREYFKYLIQAYKYSHSMVYYYENNIIVKVEITSTSLRQVYISMQTSLDYLGEDN